MTETRPDTFSILWLNQLDPDHPWAGGAERHIREVSRRLAARGHRVTVVAEAFPGLAADETRDGVRTLRPVPRGLLHAWVLSNARRLVEELGIDVVLGDLSKIVPWGKRAIGGAPLVTVVRHFSGRTIFAEAPFPAPPVLWAVERLTPMFLRGSRIVTESRATEAVLENLGAGAAGISRIPPGVDAGRFSPAPGERSGQPLIVYVGRLKRYKRLDLAIRAFALIRRDWPRAEFEIAGGGSDYDRLRALVEKLGLSDRVHFLGSVPLEEVVQLYRRAWVHVQPSRAEGWGLTAVESMACGTPVVAFNTGSLPETVGPLCADLLAEEASVPSLAAALGRSFLRDEVHNPASACSLAEYARSFTWEATAESYASVLADAVRGFGARPLPSAVRAPLTNRWSSPTVRSVRSTGEGMERVADHVDPA